MTTVDDALEVLNRINWADPTVLPFLVNCRVPCNEAVREDPTVQVGKHDGEWKVGLLGIINGLFGINEHGSGFICAVYDDDGCLTAFKRLTGTTA